MPPTVIRVRSDERVFLCGKTGSGKTYAARVLCAKTQRLIVLDPKARINPGPGGKDPWRLMPWDREARRLLAASDPVRALVRVPVGADLEEAWEPIYEAVLAAGNCTIYIDEVYGVAPNANRPSPYLAALWTRGRELGVGAFAASQRPFWVPIVMLSEATHFFNFRLRVMEDRRRMSEHMGPEVLEEVPRGDEHGFFYMRETDYEPVYLPQLPRPEASRTRERIAA